MTYYLLVVMLLMDAVRHDRETSGCDPERRPRGNEAKTYERQMRDMAMRGSPDDLRYS